MQKINVKQITVLAMLIALHVVADRFLTIRTEIVKIGFTFLPVAISAILYGPVWGAVCAGLGDIIGAFLSGFGYFPPITVSAIMTGVIYGLFLYRKPADSKRIILCVLVVNFFISFLLQTYWLSMLYGKGYFALLPTRILQNLIMTPVQIIFIRLFAYRFPMLQNKITA